MVSINTIPAINATPTPVPDMINVTNGDIKDGAASSALSDNVSRVGYRGKHFTVPLLSDRHIIIQPNASNVTVPISMDEPVMKTLNKVFDIREFATPHRPISLGVIPHDDRATFATRGAPRVLDLPIKFPGSDVRLPIELVQFTRVVQQIMDFEMKINHDCYDEYYAYLTIDQHEVTANSLHREAPVHVDGFQGGRWQPKVRNNHTYTVSDVLPTAYYPQAVPILLQLDETKHNFFWQMNAEVAKTDSVHVWHPSPWEITMMDCYCMHRGVEATATTYRTWLRLSFEVRQFDRLGNAHNPAFRYQWPMVARDIEGLNLVAYEPMDASLCVFPWQRIDGVAHVDRAMKTKPNLKPSHMHALHIIAPLEPLSTVVVSTSTIGASDNNNNSAATSTTSICMATAAGASNASAAATHAPDNMYTLIHASM